MSRRLLSANQNLTRKEQEKTHIYFHGVRVTPPLIEFKNPFEGRLYKESIRIQNVGRSSVSVRITEPSSFAYKIKCVRQQNLSPGLSLVREISYVHSHANAPSCILSIYINEHCLDYILYAGGTSTTITLTPKCIDFGIVDAGVASKKHTLEIRNDGAKATRFYIDSATSGHLVINPINGFLQPKQAAEIQIKLMSTEEGPVRDAIWVKCEQPYLAMALGNVIKPKFELINDSLSTTYSLLDFLDTYFGISVAKTVYVRNYSSCRAMFCLMGEVDSKLIDFKTCQGLIEDYKHFDVTPKDGVCEPNEVMVFHFKFMPQKPKPHEKMKSYYFCVYNVCRIRWKYLSATLYEDEVFVNVETSRVNLQTYSTSTTESTRDLDVSALANSDTENCRSQTEVRQERDFVKFYLHGIAQNPSVTVVPTELSITGMDVGRREVRVLELKNCSAQLPIILVYKKVAYVEVERKTITLQPHESVQTSVFVTPQKMGIVKSKIRFDLVYYDQPRTSDQYKVIGKLVVPLTFEAKFTKTLPLPQLNTGITPNYLKEVGIFCEDVRFNSAMEKPKAAVLGSSALKPASSALIAFPNDRQTSVRPWRNKTKIKTIFTRIPRYVAPINPDYELTYLEREFKKNHENYYATYMRKKAANAALQRAKGISLKAVSEYDLTSHDALMVKNTFGYKFISEGPKKTKGGDVFIPLTPMQINNISIDPMVIHANQLAVHSKFEFKVTITNSNPFAVRIFIRPETVNLYFTEGNRRTIKANMSACVPVLFISSFLGYYTTTLDVIVNECGVFAVTLIADICPVTLQLSRGVVLFTDDAVSNFIEITNPLNVSTRFSWHYQCKNFKIDPIDGIVRAKANLMCHIMYMPNKVGPLAVDVDFLVNETLNQQIRLLVKSAHTLPHFLQSEVEFLNMPLNMPVSQRALLENDSASSKTFCLMECQFLQYAEVVPRKGTIHANSYQVINITLTLSICINFNTSLKFQIIGCGTIELYLSGNVIYPEVDVKPSIMKFSKIPASSTEVIRFTVENKSMAMASVKFNMSMYDGYKITERRNHWESQVDTVILEKKTSKQLFIHFLPNAAVSDKFNLPILVNNMLSSVHSDSKVSRVTLLMVTDIPDSKRITTPRVSICKVQSYATEPKVCFSKFVVYLDYKYPPFKCNNTYELKIYNNQRETEDFCIRTENLNQCFSFTHVRGRSITRYTQSIVCSLAWKEEVVLEISFKPAQTGIFRSALPVYLRSDTTEQCHNTLYIEGTFASPTIACLNPINCYKPAALRINISTTKTLVFQNHYKNCIAQCFSDFKEQTMELIEGRPDCNNSRLITIRIFVQYEKPRCRPYHLTVICTCGIRYDTSVYIMAENCFLTTYAFVNTYMGNYNLELSKKTSTDTTSRRSLTSIFDLTPRIIEDFDMSDFFVSYPFFPSSTGQDEDEFVEFMNTCVSVVEDWIYTRGFFGRSYYKIPEGINFVLLEAEPMTAKSREKSAESRFRTPPFIQLLLNLAGEQFESILTPKPILNDETDKATYIYGLYAQALEFLSNSGAYFTFVCPEFLMDYEMYRTYMKTFPSDEREKLALKIDDADKFYRLSKQCWLDVILQMYKVLMLSRLIVGQKGVVRASKIICTPGEKFRASVKNICKNNHLFSTTELLLLNWLEFHYNEMRSTVWADNKFLREREMTFFGENMTDGFVYAAITLTYCPYLETHFKALFPNPDSDEEYLHNNIKVIEAWKILNFSFGITVEHLTKPHSLRTLFIIVYLYQVLPGFYPSQNLEFRVGLSQRTNQTLTIRNDSTFTVAYKAILYGDSGGCFKVDKKVYVISPKHKRTIHITYWAKFLTQVRCTLILSGESKGYYYAKSNVVTLIGSPDLSYVTETIEIPLELYTVDEISLSFRSPYMERSIHSIQFTSILCTSADEVKALPIRTDYSMYFITRLCPVKPEIEFDQTGVGTIDCTLICLRNMEVPIYFYFRNSIVGDFITKIIARCQSFNNNEVLNVNITESERDALHKKDVQVILNIPKQNKLFWNALMTGFLKICASDFDFWKKQTDTVAGMHILRKLIKVYLPGYHVELCEPVEYLIKPTKNGLLKLPDSVFIEDVCSSDSVKVPMVLPCEYDLQSNECIELETTNGHLKRNYCLNFVVDQSQPALNKDKQKIQNTSVNILSCTEAYSSK